MRILIVTGGGGHFSPALAFIRILPKDWEVLVVGRKYTFEGDKSLAFEFITAKKLGIPFQPLTTGRLQRKITRHSLMSLIKIPVGFFQARAIIKKFKPDVVLSFGGFVSVPVAYAAYFMHIPVVIHEQILAAGMANKLVARIAKKICISWKQSEKYFPDDKIVLTGNPLRKEFIVKATEQLKINKSFPVIYITGGSSGSHAFNVLIEESLEKLLQNYIVIHQTGDAKIYNDFERLQGVKEKLPPELKKRYILMKFVDPDSVADMLNQADLVISRSGMNTVTELLYLGKPSLLVPLPYGQHNEQKDNALFVQSKGLAEVIEQKLLNPESFYNMVTHMMRNLNTYKKHAEATRKLIDLHADNKILEVVKSVCR